MVPVSASTTAVTCPFSLFACVRDGRTSRCVAALLRESQAWSLAFFGTEPQYRHGTTAVFAGIMSVSRKEADPVYVTLQLRDSASTELQPQCTDFARLEVKAQKSTGLL